ncbi:MAG: hypothetical protein ACRDM7_02470, partial [Thermoleophilaceae bacterium]
DGAILGAPFPLVTPAAGAVLASTPDGELYIATTSGGGVDIEVTEVGIERGVRGVVRVPGTGLHLVVDPDRHLAAVVTDEGTFTFQPHHTDPTSTLSRIGDPARDVAIADGRVYVLMQDRLVALDLTANERWSARLVDGRRLLVGSRVVVQDGAERMLVFDRDGHAEDLGVSGTIQDVAISPDGRWAGAIVDARGAVLFRLP